MDGQWWWLKEHQGNLTGQMRRREAIADVLTSAGRGMKPRRSRGFRCTALSDAHRLELVHMHFASSADLGNGPHMFMGLALSSVLDGLLVLRYRRVSVDRVRKVEILLRTAIWA